MRWSEFFSIEEQALIRRCNMLDYQGMYIEAFPDKDSVIRRIQCVYGYRLANELCGLRFMSDFCDHEFIYEYIQSAKWQEIKRIAEMRPETILPYMQGV